MDGAVSAAERPQLIPVAERRFLTEPRVARLDGLREHSERGEVVEIGAEVVAADLQPRLVARPREDVLPLEHIRRVVEEGTEDRRQTRSRYGARRGSRRRSGLRWGGGRDARPTCRPKDGFKLSDEREAPELTCAAAMARRLTLRSSRASTIRSKPVSVDGSSVTCQFNFWIASLTAVNPMSPVIDVALTFTTSPPFRRTRLPGPQSISRL